MKLQHGREALWLGTPRQSHKLGWRLGLRAVLPGGCLPVVEKQGSPLLLWDSLRLFSAVVASCCMRSKITTF